MDTTRLKRFFLNLVIFVIGSFCGFISNSFVDIPYRNKPDNVKPDVGYEINTVLRPLKQSPSHPVQVDQTLIDTLKETPCSLCTARKLRISPAAQAQREASLSRYERRQVGSTCVQNLVDGSSPISYPAHGYNVLPMRTVWLKGIQVEWFNHEDIRKNMQLKIQINASRGTFQFVGRVQGVEINGNGGNAITMSTRSPSLLNLQLKYIAYKNTKFDTNIVDLAQLRFSKFTVTFPIHIQHVQLPWLFEGGTGQIKDRVTVVLKTFLRYDKLRVAIQAVNKYYPGTRIVVADDTPDSLFTTFQSSNVDHYRMPEYTGYFAGRNLGLSQVDTEYFFYQDDDIEITESTNWDYLLSFLDKTNFHLVGVGTLEYLHSATIETLGNKKNRCFLQKANPGHYEEIPGFPGIYTTDVVLNIFLASTHDARAVGFDPNPALSRTGHIEFFLSALGRLRVAACESCAVRHNRKGRSVEYKKNRKPGRKTTKRTYLYNLFMHNINCVRTQWRIETKGLLKRKKKRKKRKKISSNNITG